MNRSSFEINRWLDMQEEEWAVGKVPSGKKRTVNTMGPMVGKSVVQDEEIRKVKKGLDEFDLGEIFTVISKTMMKEMDSVVGKTPKDMQKVMKEGLTVLAKAVEDTMSGISDTVRQERKERKEQEKRTEEKLTKLEGKVEEKVQDVKAEVERLKSQVAQIRVAEKVREMEVKVKSAMQTVKVMDINIGLATDNKATIVREALEEVRRYTNNEEVARLDRILKRTKLVVLGRKTEGQQKGGKTVFTVPILFQCQERKDAEELDRLLRKAGYFPLFHWPREILEFIRKVREEVRKTTKDRYISIRPEIVQGKVRIRADSKTKSGSGFVMKGTWMCPPLDLEQ
jgi:hypothetical protein